MVKAPLGIRKISNLVLEPWESLGRCVSAYILAGRERVIVTAVYGFAPSHEMKDKNEDMLSQLGCWTAGLTIPSFIAGDLNADPSSSLFLMSPPMLRLWRINDDSPTTTKKAGGIANSLPIDHFIANSKCLDLACKIKVDYSVAVSDHYPLVGRIKVRESRQHNLWKWPATMKLEKICHQIDWQFVGKTYTEWAEYATKRLSQTYEVPRKSKISVDTTHELKTNVCQDQTFERMKKCMAILDRLASQWNEKAWDKLMKLLDNLRLQRHDNIDDIRDMLREALKRYLDMKQNEALSAWKQRAKTWSVKAKEVFRFLKCVEPAKSFAVHNCAGHPTRSAEDMHKELERYWAGSENWENEHEAEEIEENIEDKYAIFLPCLHWHMTVTGQDLTRAIHTMKNTSPGPDGWCKDELTRLPPQAWCDFLSLEENAMKTTTILKWYKTAPIEKKTTDTPLPQQIRPIDIYSMILRAMATAQVRHLRPWLRHVLHPNQYSSFGGAREAAAMMNIFAEKTLAKIGSVWGVSLDLAKMFNKLSVRVSSTIAGFMGLSSDAIREIKSVLERCRGIWRLPFNAVTPSFERTKNLPQGMASSVAFAEISVATLMWKLHHILAPMSIVYVDDVNVVVATREELELVLKVIMEWVEDMHLELAKDKSCLWGTQPVHLQELSRMTGIPVKEHVTTLGMQWTLSTSVTPTYEKEMSRIASAKARLARLECLQLSMVEKARIINTGCLSPLDYSPIATLTHVDDLWSAVRKALNQNHGSPEILLNVLNRISIDPIAHWIMAAAYLFKVWIGTEPSTLENICLHRRGSRIASFCKRIGKLGWTCTISGVKFPDTSTVAWSRDWDYLRERFLDQYRKSVLLLLSKRRPATFGGIRDLAVAKHVEFLNTLSAHQASLIVRVWCGCAMTAARRHVINPSASPECTCGEPSQTLPHLMYHCPHVSPPSAAMMRWKELEPAQSVALLCPYLPVPDEVRDWKEACQRALAILTTRVRVTERFDWKGHIPVTNATGQVAFCCRCFVSRKMRDQGFIASDPCRGDIMGGPCVEGDYIVLGEKVFRCVFFPWKRASQRPGFECAKCHEWAWPRRWSDGRVECKCLSMAED